MPPIGFTDSKANERAGGIKSLMVKASGDSAYYSLKKLAEGASWSVKTLSKKDSGSKNISGAAEVEAVARALYTSKDNLIKKLPVFGQKDTNWIVESFEEQTLSSENLSDPFFGVRWRFVSDADMDDFRYVEFILDRRLHRTELDALFGTAPAVGTPNPGDALYVLGTPGLSYADKVPAGLKKVEFKPSAEGVFGDVLKRIRNSKVTCELAAEEDGRGRSGGRFVKISFETETIQTSPTEIALLDSLVGTELDFRLTYIDDMTLTLIDCVGLDWDYRVDKTPESLSYIKLAGEGVMKLADFAGAIA